MEILDSVRLVLRITNKAYDGEIQDLIQAAKRDLAIAGINVGIEDALIKRAISLYVKAHFGWGNPDSDTLLKSYQMLKEHLVISGDYNVVG